MSIMTPPATHALDDLFYRLLRSRWDAAALDAAREAIRQQPPSWPDFLRFADERSLSPLLYGIMREQEMEPPAVEKSLRSVYIRNAARSTLLFATLSEILEGFAQQGVDVILLKGAALAESVYDNPALRPMMDLDLLIKRQHLSAAVQTLEARGFSATLVEPRPGATLAFDSQIRFHRADLAQTLVELHWGILDAPFYQETLDDAWFWESARPAGKGGALVFGPEAQVIHLSAHMLLHHGGPVWLGLHDLAEICYRYDDEMDWDLLLLQARKMKLVLPLQHVLPQVKAHWAAPIPDDVLEKLPRLKIAPEEQRAFHWLVQQRTSTAHHFVADFLTMPSLRGRMRYLWTQLFPSPAYMRTRYDIPSRWLTPFYYPRRWLLALSHVCTLMQ